MLKFRYWKTWDITIENQISGNYRYIEKLPNIEMLQILNAYRKIFRGSESTDL